MGVVAIGIGFAALGVALLAYGLRRRIACRRAIARGRLRHRPTPGCPPFLTGAAAVLGVLTVILLFSTF